MMLVVPYKYTYKCTYCYFLILLLIHSTIIPSTYSISTNNDNNNYNNHNNYQNYNEINQDSVILITGAASQLGSQLALRLFHTYNVKKLILVDDMNSRDIDTLMKGKSSTSSTSTNTNKNDNTNNNHDDEKNHGKEKVTITTKDDESSGSGSIGSTSISSNSITNENQHQNDQYLLHHPISSSSSSIFENNEFFTIPGEMQNKHRSEESISSFEYKRQRLFHVLQSISSSITLDDFEEEREDEEFEQQNQQEQQHEQNQSKNGEVYNDIIQERINNRVSFYKADIRPTMPEFLDYSKYPLLDSIFQVHEQQQQQQQTLDHQSLVRTNQITHVVHLDTENILNPNVTNQIIPRRKDDTQMGLMDGLLEQLRVLKERDHHLHLHSYHSHGGDNGGDIITLQPHFVYASTSEIYNVDPTKKTSSCNDDNFNNSTATTTNTTNTTITMTSPKSSFSEEWNITTPRTKYGASKLMDEILAKTYHDVHNIFSIGLRFFPIYGPWSTPPLSSSSPSSSSTTTTTASSTTSSNHPFMKSTSSLSSSSSTIFEMAERAISSSENYIPSSKSKIDLIDDISDYVYIDDAVDAIIAAMQFNPNLDSNGEQSSSSSSSSSSNSSTADTTKSTGNKESTKTIPSFVVNVGSGHGSSISEIAQIMEHYFPRSHQDVRTTTILEQIQSKNNIVGDNVDPKKDPSPSLFTTCQNNHVIANMTRAEFAIGYKPITSLEEGIRRTLVWHYDRSFPFGTIDHVQNDTDITTATITKTSIKQQQQRQKHHNGTDTLDQVKQMGIESCSPYDIECLNGATIFPCSSDCSHTKNCVPSIYDDIIQVSRVLTSNCVDVMYTVNLEGSLVSIPSSSVGGTASSSSSSSSSSSISSLIGSHCNIAFVNEGSSLMMRLKHLNNIKSDVNVGDELLLTMNSFELEEEELDMLFDSKYLFKHGFWTLLPVSIPSSMRSNEIQKLAILPKLSPGLFFAMETKFALYCDIDVIFRNAPSLLQVLKSQPANAGMAGETILMFGMTTPDEKHKNRESPSSSSSSTLSLQERAYNSVRIALGPRMGIPPSLHLDTSWMIHTLSSEDAHSLRCDMFSEMKKWGSSNDFHSIGFIVSLNDFWGSMLATWNTAMNNWWQKYNSNGSDHHEKLSSNIGIDNHGDVGGDIGIDTNLGYWMSTPSNGRLNFVRLIPSDLALMQTIEN